jgi:hypothetical protein
METGKLEKADYDSLIPEAKERISRYGKVNVYWKMKDFVRLVLLAFLIASPIA